MRAALILAHVQPDEWPGLTLQQDGQQAWSVWRGPLELLRTHDLAEAWRRFQAAQDRNPT